MIKSSSK